MFDSRASLPNEVRADIEQFLNDARGTDSAWAEARILPTYIRRNIKLAEAPSYGKTIFEYEPNCHGAEDYKNVAEFVHTRFELPTALETPPVIQIETEGEHPSQEQVLPLDSENDQDPDRAQSDQISQSDIQIPQEPTTESPESDDTQTPPPFEIRSIPAFDSQTPTEFSPTPGNPDQHETEKKEF
jgi:hypothetical protein